MKALDRYIIREVVSPFFFGLGAFTILFFAVETMIGVARMITESDMPYSLVLEYLGCRLPQVLIFTFPMASLMACLLAFGRLSGEAELTAMRASGLSFLRIAFPALIFFFVLSAFSFWMNDAVVPHKMKRAYEILFSSQEKEIYQKALLTAPKALKSGLEQMLYAHKFNLEEKTMQGVYIHYLYEDRRRREIYAEKARWNGKVWELFNVRHTEYDKYQNPHTEVEAKKGWSGLSPGESPPGPDEISKRDFRPEEMTRAELADALIALAGQPAAEIAEKRDHYAVMYHQKEALPWVSFIFATFAIPLGVRPHRSSRSMGLGLSLVFILVYYILMTVGMVLGEAGSVDPLIGAWLPNLVFGTMGLGLLISASRS
jgi:lipopolysaccharide export system permease protein